MQFKEELRGRQNEENKALQLSPCLGDFEWDFTILCEAEWVSVGSGPSFIKYKEDHPSEDQCYLAHLFLITELSAILNYQVDFNYQGWFCGKHSL